MAIPGERTILKLDGTAIAAITNVSGPNMSVAEVETTDNTSAAKRFRPSLIPEIGTLTCSVWYDSSSHATLVGCIETPAIHDWQVVYQDESTMDFEGFLTSLNLTGGEMGQNIKADLTIRIDGEIGGNSDGTGE